MCFPKAGLVISWDMSDGRDKFLVSGPTTAVSGMSLGYKECCNWRQCRCGLTLDQPCDSGADGQTMHARVTVWSVGNVPQWDPRWFVPVWANTTVNIDTFSRQPRECSNCRKCRDYPEHRVKKSECVCYRVSSLLCVPSVSGTHCQSSGLSQAVSD